jgi:hypothetical protein
MMRLIQKGEILTPYLTLAWEIEYLAEQQDRWVPFCFNGHTEPIGAIHARTHEIRLHTSIPIMNRQIVVLKKSPS